ncbi:hypothetical protein PInf_005373 [Phytophthora infestans]|nr:hypothetical protein PInf_005373 [Phytophthora infestans]
MDWPDSHSADHLRYEPSAAVGMSSRNTQRPLEDTFTFTWDFQHHSGKKGHPGDHCFYVCRGCGEIHDVGKCPMEEFYNQIRQWFDPAKHRGMLPEVAEKMLN